MTDKGLKEAATEIAFAILLGAIVIGFTNCFGLVVAS